MQVIKIDEVVVGENRQRREFKDEAISALAESIASSRGLLHPIVVREIGNNQYQLVAGERRLRAIQSLQILGTEFYCDQTKITKGHVPVTLVNDLNELELEEAELEENVLRVDLTVQEQAQAVARLHRLREKQKGSQSFSDTAREIYPDANPRDKTRVQEQLLIASHLDIPEVAKAKTHNEAVKVIEKIKKAEHRAKLAETFDMTKTDHVLKLGDSRELVRELPDAYFDLIVTDPPYGIDADNFGSQSSGHNYKDDFEFAMSCYNAVAVEGFRVTKSRASVYAFCHMPFFAHISQMFEAAGWIVWPRPLIWAKLNGMLPKPDFGPRNTYEAIIFAYKPGTEIILQGQNDVLIHRVGTGLEHGAQKPVSLFRDLMRRSANPGARVLDMFAGSGTIFPAANTEKMLATAFEAVEANYNLALSRVNDSEEVIPYDV